MLKIVLTNPDVRHKIFTQDQKWGAHDGAGKILRCEEGGKPRAGGCDTGHVHGGGAFFRIRGDGAGQRARLPAQRRHHAERHSGGARPERRAGGHGHPGRVVLRQVRLQEGVRALRRGDGQGRHYVHRRDDGIQHLRDLLPHAEQGLLGRGRARAGNAPGDAGLF